MEGIGSLCAPDVEFKWKREKGQKTAIVNQIVDKYSSLNESVKHENKREYKFCRTLISFVKNGAEKNVLIRVSANGETGFTVNKSWEGEALFFLKNERGEICLENIVYDVYYFNEEQYRKLKQDYSSGKIGSNPLRLGTKLTLIEVEEYFR